MSERVKWWLTFFGSWFAVLLLGVAATHWPHVVLHVLAVVMIGVASAGVALILTQIIRNDP